MLRFEDDRSAVVVAQLGHVEDAIPRRSRLRWKARAASRVFRTGEPARIDDYATASGAIAETARAVGVRGVVATPILVEGRLWGAIVTGTTQDEPLPPETESRLASSPS